MNKTISKTIIFTLCILAIGQQCSGMEAPIREERARQVAPSHTILLLQAQEGKNIQLDLEDIKNDSNQELIVEKMSTWNHPIFAALPAEKLIGFAATGKPIVLVDQTEPITFEEHSGKKYTSFMIRNEENPLQKPLQLTFMYDPLSSNLNANLYVSQDGSLKEIAKSTLLLNKLPSNPHISVKLDVPNNWEKSKLMLTSPIYDEKKSASKEYKKAWKTEEKPKIHTEPNAFKRWVRNWWQDMELRTFGPGKDGSRIPDYMKRNPHSK